MERAKDFILCVNCDKKFRPLFKICTEGHLICQNCNQHQNVETGKAEPSTNCSNKQFSMKSMNIIFRTIDDNCQYKCGHRANIVDIASHEKTCLMNVKCAIEPCKWNKGLSDLASHFLKDHPGRIIDMSRPNPHCVIDFNNPIALLTQFEKTSPDNQLYYLRLLRDKNLQYIMMQHQGQTGDMNDTEVLIQEICVSSLNYANVYVNTKVLRKASDANILNDAFLLNKGSNITLLRGHQYLVKIKDLGRPMTMTEAVKSDIECFICLEIMVPPIRMCSNGHSMCGTCAVRSKNCGKCRKRISKARNYTLESLIENITKKRRIVFDYCKYKVEGCSFTGVEDLLIKHEEFCKFQPTKCVLLTTDACVCQWTGSFVRFHQHINQKHFNEPEYLNVRFMVYEVTPQKTSDYYFDIALIHANDGFSTVNTKPCKPIFGNSFWDVASENINNFNVSASWFKSYFVKEGKTAFVDLKIYRKPS